MRKTERAIFLTEARHICTEGTAWLALWLEWLARYRPFTLTLGSHIGCTVFYLSLCTWFRHRGHRRRDSPLGSAVRAMLR